MLRHLRIFKFNDLKDEVEWNTMLGHFIITSSHNFLFTCNGQWQIIQFAEYYGWQNELSWKHK